MTSSSDRALAAMPGFLVRLWSVAFRAPVTRLVVTAALFGMACAHAAPQPFNEATWQRLLAQGPRPAAYLFTTSYCSTCPAAFEVLHKAAKASGVRPRLAAVMMDVDGKQAQAHAGHFMGMTDLFVFDGFEPAIRQAVDPKWPNVTPYVVLFDRQGGVQRVIGPPDPAMLGRWLDKRLK